jgi:hypothetical protein
VEDDAVSSDLTNMRDKSPEELQAIAEESVRRRHEIYQPFVDEYWAVYRAALGRLGPGWKPHYKHSLMEGKLVDQARRVGGKAEPALVVYTVRHEDRDADGNHVERFLVARGQEWEVHRTKEGAFGPMPFEKASDVWLPVFRPLGVLIHPHKYQLWCSVVELPQIKSAEQLLKERATREANRKQREREEYPLLALMEDAADATQPA